MKTPGPCEQFSDALIDSAAIPPDLAAHLETCESCRELRRQIEALREVPTLLEKPSPDLRQKILDRLLRPPSPPEPTWWSSLEKWLLSPSLALALILLVIFGDLGFRLTRTVQQPSSGGASIPAEPFSQSRQAFFQEMPAGTSRQLPDKSRIEAVSIARVDLFDRGFALASGEVIANAEPGPATFTVKTPHGSILVLGTIFSVKVSSEGSDVKVTRGKILVVPLSGQSQTLVAGDFIRMVSSFPRLASEGEKIHIAPATGDAD